ncbi:hypothetical protein [Paenibacillus alvei]|uniref:hypothetical protein n=1 Tax=Paenibacillus alvei TaxID=44250 RepID=UPI0022816DDB|nr:hypothetical protein [Paenibacillus alvei]MCY7487792.1 hypothetical protein [Paenibacillus alvei]
MNGGLGSKAGGHPKFEQSVCCLKFILITSSFFVYLLLNLLYAYCIKVDWANSCFFMPAGQCAEASNTRPPRSSDEASMCAIDAAHVVVTGSIGGS